MDLIALQSITIAMVIGVSSYILSRKLRIPAILFYLFFGLVVGNIGLQWIKPDSLGGGLHILLEIVVAIILFEGGLSLSSHSFKAESSAIRRILIVTLPLTGIGAALLAHYILELSWNIAIFFGALIVVTGPTVIGSILKSVYLNRRLETLLNWESIWGDVIGVLLSAVALEMVDLNFSDSFVDVSLVFLLRIFGGIIIGIACGFLLTYVLEWTAKLKDSTLLGIASVTGAIATFTVANAVLHSSGPLAAAVAGFYLSNTRKTFLPEVRHFKEQVSSLFISSTFVLLSAYVNPLPLMDKWWAMAFVAVVLGALVRPLSILIAFVKTNVTFREQLFIGIIGPRGIVAVATASYATLVVSGYEYEMSVVLNLTFAIIFFSGVLATVACRPLASALDVRIPASRTGLLIVGINPFSSALAEQASKFVPVSFLETDRTKCLLADHLGLETICTDLLDAELYEEALEDGYARLLATTRNDALNELIASKASVYLDSRNVFQVPSNSDEETIRMVVGSSHNFAFDGAFSIVDAEEAIKSNKACIKILEHEDIAKNKAIPLIEIVDEGKGLRIISPDDQPKNKAMCLVRV